MPLDVGKLALRPAMKTFARAVQIEPRASGSSGDAAYPARGVYTSTPLDIALEGGGVLSDQRTTLGIMLDDLNGDGSTMFPQPPKQGDRVQVALRPGAAVIGTEPWYNVADVSLDGQGGSMLTLQRVPDE